MTDTSLVSTAAAVRRSIAGRTADAHLVEDITQETLVRVAATGDRLDDRAREAYAIVTARHLLADHGRRLDRDRRHEHRLVEYVGLDGPEETTLQQEETDALAAALGRLGTQDRQLLVAHESDGVPLSDLATQHRTSKGALAVRLARIRATVRVEFVLAFRRVTLPDPRCRVVLLALSAGDTRRQKAIGAADHLLICPTCAGLSRPLVERRRAIAAITWLVGISAVVRQWIRAAGRHPLATGAGVTAVAAGAILAVIALRPESTPVAAPPITASPATTAATTTVATTSTVPPTTVPLSAPPTGSLSIDGIPLAVGADLAPHVGRTISGVNLPVVAVPAARGFWVAPDGGPRLWIQMGDAAGRPAGTFRTGQAIDIHGTLEPLAGSPAELGVDGPDATELENTGFYVLTDHERVSIH